MARPKKNDEDRGDYRFQVRLNEQERALVESAAKIEGDKPSSWARAVLLKSAAAVVKRAGKVSPEG